MIDILLKQVQSILEIRRYSQEKICMLPLETAQIVNSHLLAGGESIVSG
jgi:hypothetical protein